MKSATSLLAVLLLCAAQALAADESFHGALRRASDTHHPSQYSFTDLYRLAVSGPSASFELAPAGEAPMRTAATQPAAQFSVSEEPQPLLLLLSGLALAIWVARRRLLGYAF